MHRPPQYPIRKTILLTTLLALCALPGLRAEDPLPLPKDRQTPEEIHRPIARRAHPRSRVYPWDAPADQEARKALSQVLPKFEFDELPFKEALDRLREACHFSMMVNWVALEAAAVEKDKEITLHAKGVAGTSILEAVLDQAGGGETCLTYRISGGLVKISTCEDMCRYTFTVVYDVRDLLAREKPEKGESTRWDPLEKLVQLILETVEPESWRTAGGNVGSILTFGDLIIVNQSSLAHEAIYDLLETMRDTYRDQP